MAENQVYLIKSGQNSFVEETEAIIGISGGKLGIGTTHPQAFFHVTGSVKIGGDLAVDGTFTTINSNTISVDDKNIELGSTDNPTDVTADGGGITVKGASDKTFNWSGNNSAWTSSEHLYLADGKHFSADELRALDSDGLKLADATTSGVLIKGGKVGIHQASPVYDLDVDGSGNFTSLYVGGNAVLTGEGSIFGKWEDGATPGEIYYTVGNVGVGTNNPEHKLHVVGDSVVDGNFIVNGTSGNLNVSNFNVSGDSIVLNYLGDTLASNRGGLIVKDSSNASKSLEYVEGSNFWLSSESVQIADGKELQTDKVRAIDGDGLYLHDDNGNGIFIEDGGNVGIKNITPSVALDVSGSAKISADLNVLDDIVAGGSISVGVGKFNVSNDGAVGGAAPGANDVIKWSSTQGKWIAGTSPGGGGSSSSEVPLAFAAYLDSANGSEHPIVFPDAPVGGYDDVPSIATDLEIEGDGPLVPYYISGLSNTGYYAVFAQDITVDNSYKLHTTFGGRDVFWRTGVDAGSIYYNLGDVSIGDNLTVGGNLTVNGTTTTVNTETVEIKDHNLVIASNTGYNQLTSEYPGAGDGYAGLYWGTGDNPNPSPVSLTYQTNKGFAFEGGNVGIGTTNPSAKLQVDAQAGEYSLNTDNFNQVGLLIKSSAVAGKDAKGGSIAFTSVAGGGGKHAAITAVQTDNDSNNVGLAFEVHSGGTSNDPLIEAMRIDRNGNVGIGTTNPDTNKLYVNGTVKADRFYYGSDSTHFGSLVLYDASGDTVFDRHWSGGETDFIIKHAGVAQLVIKEGGNVGIGTTNPGAALHIERSTGLAALRLQSGDADQKIQFNGGAGTLFSMGVDVSEQNLFVFSTSSISNALSIKQNGNVGIGTTNPSAKLFIKGTQAEEAQITISADNTSGPKDAILFLNATRGLNNAGSNAEIRATHDGGSGLGKMLFATRQAPGTGDPTAAMAIDSEGNVGIGTTNPGTKLQVDTNSDAVYADSNQGSNFALTLKNTPSIDGGKAGNNVGIAFYNYSTGNSFGRISYISSVQEQDGLRYSNLVFGTDDGLGDRDEKMRITSAGNVGIGTTVPNGLLELYKGSGSTGYNHLRLITEAGGGLQIGALSDNANPTWSINTHINEPLVFSGGTNEYMRIQSGNVGIGTTDPGTNKLYVGGNIYASGTITPSSDDRVKHNEQNIVGAIETLGKLTPKKYIKTTEMYEANHDFELDADGNPVDANGEPVEHSIEAGVIAQQVLEVPELAFMVSPEGVDEDGNVTSPHGLNYNSLFTYAIAAIQEQQSIIEDLKSQNASLESRISALES